MFTPTEEAVAVNHAKSSEGAGYGRCGGLEEVQERWVSWMRLAMERRDREARLERASRLEKEKDKEFEDGWNSDLDCKEYECDLKDHYWAN
ncbi:hypothetical protein NC653_019824 [Populus alba x Populus x berolinensis]|uniref:Uncharacterized protein n=1 Tax=Populus alba x Populus x berolinensis TaxID=444605 RepID=A0AAD6MIX2_9ROSI|nr:hypothetical protein NC653_019824 [Populus alba x Populus x berolinensis]